LNAAQGLKNDIQILNRSAHLTLVLFAENQRRLRLQVKYRPKKPTRSLERRRALTRAVK
jgi:hypothetical protein